MTNLSELNKVIKALGGTGGATNNAEAIGKIAALAGGGGGAGTFEVTFSVDTDTWSADKTFAELKAAINGGQNIRGLMAGERTTCLNLDGWYFAEGDTESVYFSIMTPMQGESSWTLAKRDFAFSSDESVSVEENSFVLTPAT